MGEIPRVQRDFSELPDLAVERINPRRPRDFSLPLDTTPCEGPVGL